MKIHFVIPKGTKGGLENVINETALYLQSKGHDVIMVQIIPTGLEWINDDLERYYLSEPGEMLQVYEVEQRYTDFLEEHGMPDAVLAIEWPALSAICKKAINSAKVPTKVIYWPHSSLKIYEENGAGGMSEISSADGVLALNNKTVSAIKDALPDVPTIKIHDPVDTSHLLYSDDRDSFELAFVGRLSKNFNVVFDAFLQLLDTPWTLTVVGDDGDIEGYRNICNEYGISDRVKFLGWQDHPWKHLTHASLHVSASGFEALMMTGVEALLCGMPVISTPTDGALEYVVPGETGFLYPYGDSDMLSEILRMVSDGKLPLPAPVKCKEAALSYAAENALPEIEKAIMSLIS